MPQAHPRAVLAVAGLAAAVCASAAEEARGPSGGGHGGIERVELLCSVDALSPGEPFTVGLLLLPLPEHHTYWKSPGTVGVATTIEWTLPEGFEAGEILWPPPETVSMAGVTAHGYRGRTVLLTEITPPPVIEADEVEIRALCGWMACAVSCHPGTDEFALRLPVLREGAPEENGEVAALFAETRASLPPPAPGDWSFVPRIFDSDRIELELRVPRLHAHAAEGMRFFSCDLQVDSNQAQTLVPAAGTTGHFRLYLPRSSFAPAAPDSLAGLLHLPGGWPGIDSPWIEVTAPWPAGTFDDEANE